MEIPNHAPDEAPLDTPKASPPTLFGLLTLGFSLIPCGKDKKPLIRSWKPYQSRRSTAEEVRAWVKESRPPCFAVVTGTISKLVVLDFDGKQGEETRKRLGLRPHVRTGSGGSHVYFMHPGWRVPTLNAKSKRALGERWPGLDIRADGGYAICLGRTSKGEYIWLQPFQPLPLDKLPLELREFLGLDRPPEQTAANRAAIHTNAPPGPQADTIPLIEKALRNAADQGRNNAGFRLAAKLRDQGYSEEEAECAMREYAARVPAVNQHGDMERYTIQEALASLRQAYLRSPREPREGTDGSKSSAPSQAIAPGGIVASERTEKLPQLPEAVWHPLAREYYEIVNRGSETPESFHLAAFLVAMGVALGRSIWLDHFRPLYPNVWCVLVGKSGRVHKDHAMNPAVQLARELYDKLPVMTSVDSREGLIAYLEKCQKEFSETQPIPALINLTEVRLLVDKANREGGRNIIPTMAEFYNCPEIVENTSKGASGRVRWPTVSFVAGTTMNWLSQLRAEDIEGGLGNRLMWVAGERGMLQSWATPLDSDREKKLVINIGGALQYWRERPDHEIKMNEEARNFWDALYREKYGPDLPDELVSTLAARAQEHCLKAAMIYAALDKASEITKEHLGRAALWTDFLIEGLWYLFTDFGQSPMMKVDKKITTYLKRAGAQGAPKRNVYWACKPVDTEIFNRRIKALVEADEVRWGRQGRRKVLVHADHFAAAVG